MPTNQISDEELMKRYELAIKRTNDDHAMTVLANMLLSGRLSSGAIARKNDQSRGLQLLERAVKQAENPRAMVLLALHLRDHGNKKQRRRVVTLLEDAFRQMADPISLHILAKVLFDGKCGQKDRPRAIQLFERSLKLSPNPGCMADFALVLLATPEPDGNKARALRLYKRAIKLSKDPEIMFKLARVYDECIVDVKHSVKHAIKWYQRAITVGDHCDSKYYLACILSETMSVEHRDPLRAARLLEDARVQNTERSLLCLANVYIAHAETFNFARAVLLLERAVRDFGSENATITLLHFFAFGFCGCLVDFQRAISICDAYLPCANPQPPVTMIMASILWSGAYNVTADRERAIQIAKQITTFEAIVYELMLRYDTPTSPANRQLAAVHYNNLEPRHYLMKALLIGEEEDPNFDSIEAEHAFRLARESLESFNFYGWIPLYIRKSTLSLPYHGNERCFTKNIMRFCTVLQITSLNLASLLLDRPSKSPEQCAEIIDIFESLRETELRDIATLNLFYVLWYGVGGIAQDQPRALRMLVRFCGETHDLSARVLLASTLAERADECYWNLHVSLGTLESVRIQVNDEEELLKLFRLLSPKAIDVFMPLIPQGVADG